MVKIDVNVFILGEFGIGKEVVVWNVYLLFKWNSGLFVLVNCGVIFGELFESELFGYEKGVFIGVILVWKGCFELV